MNVSDILMMNQNWGLAFSLCQEKVSVVNKICICGKSLNSYFPEISQGLIAYDKYQGQSPEIIKSRAFHHTEYKKGLKKWLWGEDVKKYKVTWNGKEYIDYCDGIANPRQPKFFLGKRLLVREITNPSIYAAITNDELYNDPAIIIVKDSKDYSLDVVMAILNSKLASFYHFNHSPKASKGAFPKILVQDIKDFPIPLPSDDLKSKIIDKVAVIVSNKENRKDTVNDEAEIDNLVYHLYGLTYNEVLIVDPKTSITREDYESN